MNVACGGGGRGLQETLVANLLHFISVCSVTGFTNSNIVCNGWQDFSLNSCCDYTLSAGEGGQCSACDMCI